MQTISVQFNLQDVQSMLCKLQKQVLPLATSRALNKTSQAAKSAAVKLIAKDMSVKQKDIRSSITLLKATRIKLQAIVQARGQRLPIIKLDPHATQTNIGVTYKGQNGQRKQIAGAFIATMKTGHRGVYKRAPGAKRLPIMELHGPSIPHVFCQAKITQALEETVNTRWPVIFQHEVEFELQRRGYC
jgi:hypothetical protein